MKKHMKTRNFINGRALLVGGWISATCLIGALMSCGGDNLPPGPGQIIPNPERSYQPVSGSAFPATPAPASPFPATPMPQSPFPNASPFPATPRPAPPF